MQSATPLDPDDVHDAEEYDLSLSAVESEEFVAVESGTPIQAAIDRFHSEAPDVDAVPTVYYVYVVDEEDVLLGVASLRELLTADREAPIDEVMATDLVTFDVDADAEEAAAATADHHYPAYPVLEDGQLSGIVRVNDLLDLVEEEATTDILKMAGMDLSDVEEERSRVMLDASILDILKIRVPWLVVALAGGFLAGGVIGVYEESLEAVVVLAFFIPVIMDMGGNVGTQSSTIFIRGVVLGHIDRSNVLPRVIKEVAVGLLIGLSVGAIAAVVAQLWVGGTHPEIGLVVLGSMVGTCVVAALVGFVIPWVMHVFGQDPAAASNPIITTIKDVSGLLIYFTLAALLLAELSV